MLTLPSSVQIWMASKPVDLRRGIDSLLALVRTHCRISVASFEARCYCGPCSDNQEGP